MEPWTVVSALASVAGALGTAGTIFALYHSRMLDTGFHAKCTIHKTEDFQVLCVQLVREKIGGASGRIVRIEIDPKPGLLVATKRPTMAVGVVGYGGSPAWEPPVFDGQAEVDLPFSPLDKQLDFDCWLSSAHEQEFRAHILISYNRRVAKTKRLAIYARAQQQTAKHPDTKIK